MSVEKYGWAIQKSLFGLSNQDSTFSHTCENSKMLNITSKYFSVFHNKPPTSWVAHITSDFLSCYSCSYYSSMITVYNFIVTISCHRFKGRIHVYGKKHIRKFIITKNKTTVRDFNSAIFLQKYIKIVSSVMLYRILNYISC